MRRSSSFYRLPLVVPLLLLAITACDCGEPSEPDGGAPTHDAGKHTDAGRPDPTDAGHEDAGDTDAGHDDAGIHDAGLDSGTDDAGHEDAGRDDAGHDAGYDDAGYDDAGHDDAGYDDAGAPDASEPPPSFHPQPVVTTCEREGLPLPPSGQCEVTTGSDAKLLTGDVLTPGEVLRGGQVLVAADGTIGCVGCDCGSEPPASAATRVVCSDVVISPGLINAHDHVTFAGAWPYGDTRPGGTNRMTDERYEHRHDWRDGLEGHTRIPSLGGTSSTMAMKWLEWRQLMSGTTSILGSGGPEGFLRNLDSDTRNGLPREGATYQTFPLGDAVSGLKLYDSCEYAGCSGSDCFEEGATGAFVPHVAEGIDRYARNEMLCLSRGQLDVTEPESAFIHGVGLLPVDMAEMAEAEVELIWSPRSNITLYGDTARVTEFARLGVTIGLGTDWVATGSMNMLRELACADFFNERYLEHFFSDEQLWLMATRNSARALRVDDVLGTLAVGALADLALYDASRYRDHRAVLNARPEDVALVLIGGKVQYGDATLVEQLAPGGCELLPEVCGSEKRACLADEVCYPGCTAGSGSPTPCTWELLKACGDEHEASPQYPAWFCEQPADEPSCLPARTSTGDPLPDASVNGSNRYDGMSTLDDVDGDGVPNDEDNCPSIFNPIRPLDDGAQADSDGDGIGDACDPCPLGGDDEPESCNVLPHLDLDRDGVPRDDDVCPDIADPLQEDADGDGIGDACDPCPSFATPRGSATVYGARCGGLALGEWVTLSELVVTAVTGDGFFAQQAPESADYAGAAYSGIFVDTELPPEVLRGDLVEVTARLQGHDTTPGLTRLVLPTVTWLDTSPLPEPVVVDPLLVATGGAEAVPYESVLVQVDDVTVTAPSVAGDFVVADALVVGGALFAIDPLPAERFSYLRGVLAQRGLESKLLPRDAFDVGFTTFRLSPGHASVQVERAVTFIVSLPAEAPLEGTLVSLSLDPADLLEGPLDVLVPSGERHATFELLAGAEAGDATLYASYDEHEAIATVSVVTEGRLLFTEYVEGTGSHKAIELGNVGGSPLSLAPCTLRLYANGSEVPTSSAPLSGTLAPGAQFVLCNAGTDSAETRCDATSATVNHNGDDAYDLVCLGETVDTFGRIGERPTSPPFWRGGGYDTQDFVLRRRCEVSAGDLDGADPFDPSVEWEGEAWQTPAISLAGLGHRDECLPPLDGGPDDGGLDDGGSE